MADGAYDVGAVVADPSAFVDRFRFPLFPEGHRYVDVAGRAVFVERRDEGWVVTDGSAWWAADGTWVFEGEGRGLARFRFSLAEAVAVAVGVVVPTLRDLWDGLISERGSRG